MLFWIIPGIPRPLGDTNDKGGQTVWWACSPLPGRSQPSSQAEDQCRGAGAHVEVLPRGPCSSDEPKGSCWAGRHTPEIPGRQEAGDGRGGASFKVPRGSSGWKDLRGLITSTLGTRWGFEEVSGSKQMESRSQHLQISRSQESSLIYNLRLRHLGTEVRN